jgi:hypothetical protein
MPFGVWKGQKALLFLFLFFIFDKKILSHCRGCKHSKLGGSGRSNYSLTFTPLEHISHLHDQVIASDGFCIWEKTIDLLQVIDF